MTNLTANFTCPNGNGDFSNMSFCDFFPEQCGPDRPYIKIPMWELFIKLAFYLLVFAASFFGNVIVILVVYLYRQKMQSSAYIYLLNLSVAGLIIALGCMWPYFMVSIAHEYPLGSAMCKIHPFLQLTSMVASVLTLALISLDQFVAVAFPLHARFTTSLRPVWVIIGIWIISAGVSVPLLVHKEHIVYRFSDFSSKTCIEAWPSVQIFDPYLATCFKHEPSKTTYYTFITAALFFFPIGVMIVAYSVIMAKVWSSHVPGDLQEHNTVLHARSKSKIVKLVAAVLFGFLACWMPLQVLILYSSFKPSDLFSMPEWYNQFGYFAHFIAYANSAINPLIYCFLNSKFRQGFLYVLTCQKNRRRRSLQEGATTEIALMRTENNSRKGSKAVSFRISNQSSFNYEDNHLASRRESLDVQVVRLTVMDNDEKL
ncbi:QRFP-like peptide receptor isoform X2 [Paramacrobiotus metropolitanus]|uniref:QRFP-like peptide receptor isoform X2 n=1 Tax=Paramacrobiotus metropolitanus TaxID=2943436 RepID=UPI002445D6A1|nr:QRFP-like peptide receptor isoform X2 [Paramacrobiotus metropolitanus]